MKWFWIVIGLPGFLIVGFMLFIVLGSSLGGLIDDIKRFFK